MDSESDEIKKDLALLGAKLERKLKETDILNDVSSGINRSLELNETLEALLSLLDKYFDFHHSMILLTQPGDRFLKVFASFGYQEAGIGAKVEIGKGVIGMVAKNKKMMRFGNITQRLAYVSGKDVSDVEREITINLPGLKTPKSSVAIPLIIKEELVGVLCVESEGFNIFKKEDETTMSILANQAAIAIQNARLFEAEKERYDEVQESNKKLNDLLLEQQKTLNLFMRYVPEPVVKKGLSEQTEDIFKGEQIHIALLFCDIRNFTPLSERIKPDEVVFVLNNYYSHMSEVIKKHQGIINQFVGDEIFVSFGAPLTVTNPAEKAVLCAVEMVEHLKTLNVEMKKKFQTEINVGIGVNYGQVVAGNLGSEDRIEYSITGDTVNTAKRIESLTRGHPNAILISESIFKRTEHLIESKSWEPIEVKGKAKKVQVYQILKLKE